MTRIRHMEMKLKNYKMNYSARYIWMLPVVSIFIGIMVLFYGYWERQKVVGEIEQLFRDHVNSLALLVKEGAYEGAAATALLYELTEEHLLTSANLFAVTYQTDLLNSNLLSDEECPVKLIQSDYGKHIGYWGSIKKQDREIFIRQMMQADQGEMVDYGVARKLGLICLHQNIENNRVFICRNSSRLDKLRKETGIGALLKGVIQKDIIYVAIQDESGILAAAPSASLLSKWNDDVALSEALNGQMNENITRVRKVEGHTIFEGLVPFLMADGSRVILRVGVDSAVLLRVRENSKHRYLIMNLLVLGVFTLSLLISLLLSHWSKKQQKTDAKFIKQEEERKHWETIGQMAATVAHEVRNPLNTLGMISQRLGTEFSIKNDERKSFNEMLGLLQSESKRVDRVVSDFLELGKPLVLNLEHIDAKTAIYEAIASIQIRAEQEGKKLVLDNACNLKLALDKKRFNQIITNLVGNALDAISTDGEVSLVSRCKNDALHISIHDNGYGMEPSKVSEVMKPFISFKSNGTGLGLPLVERLIKAHGGKFELSSVKGEGTTASFFIPANRKTEEEN